MIRISCKGTKPDILQVFVWLQEWMLFAPNEDLHLPAPNVFIPTDLSLKDAQEKVWWNSIICYMIIIFLFVIYWCDWPS
jgi:hypothetical protein